VNRRRIVAVTASTVVVAGLVTAGIAHARAGDGEPLRAPRGQNLPHSHRDPSGGFSKDTVLECDPPGGDHPHAEQACATLAAADGQIANITPTPGEMCPHLVAPVRATARGHYGATPINYDHTWNNACEMTRATGEVFDF